MSDRPLVIVAALCLLIGVGAGAFGAHGLKRMLSVDMMQIWQTAVLYQLVHGLGMLAIAALMARFGSPLLEWAGALMLLGIVLFSGSLYVLALSGTKWLGAVTPLGGAAFIAAWALVALAAWRHS
ncbi:DUF423 domain-containing protein [Pusillimonas noertemannii]|uniref:Uncharacterized membrane protein YgdD (TMEM256/DUF423 family) n=1 Tax=Pusillimonas noertemannii TaxID=305977 RepID=A0A2U1CLN0_9BURK|nr:DUF423 domain-containing protein [Pusillimonas noertemannii]NYT69448.1 DUF423 domain-containing protein [Pusillimonas noertemannii]PVY61916.1 uncharacterized membrane protein YgdD (TMEM256/DUF423 family) [Pusillimonas noertemannii]TFL09834.1 DUF423 domain-containing protein [Pusillimonas noertemannii]